MMRWELALAGVVLMTQTAVAQVAKTPEGWPGAAPAPAAAPARPADKPKAEAPAPKKRAKTKRAAKPAEVVKPAEVAARPAAPVPEAVTAAVVVPVAMPAVEAPKLTPPAAEAMSASAEAPAGKPVVPKEPSADLVAALQQQSQLLSRLASELDASRAVVAEQGRLLAALETKAATAIPAAAAPPPPPPVITVDTGGAKLRLAGLVQGWFTASDAGVADTFRLRRGEVKLGGEVNRRVRWDLMLDPAKALSVSNSYVTVNGQRVMSDTSVGRAAGCCRMRLSR
jgi:hypothetical protein